MTDISAQPVKSAAMAMEDHSPGVVLRSIIIGLTAFLTVVDLFATQAILPSLARHYQVAPAAMGFAVNATTMGMAVAGLVVGFFSPHIDRRLGILISLTVLAIPTSLLASAPNLTIFTLLRITQGLCMASAFALTLAYLGEQCSAMDAGGAFAAYITGNVASNLIGRLISAAVADTFGLAVNFYFFAVLNLVGAALVYFTIQRVKPMHSMALMQSPLAAMIEHWRNPRLRAAFGIGFCILFAFIHRYLHLRQFRAGAHAAVARDDGPRVGLFRLPALDRHHASRRPGGRAIWHEARDLGRARSRDDRLAADAVLPSERGPDRHGIGQRWNIFCAGRGNRICRTGRAGKSRRGQRHVSRLLFCRRPGRQRRSRPAIRPPWLD
jgi:hypothetical protein